MKKTLSILMLSFLFIISLSACNTSKSPGVYPVVKSTAELKITGIDTEISGMLTYNTHNNLSFSYTKPKAIGGFTVSIKGSECETSLNGLTRKVSSLPFSENSPIRTLLGVLKIIELGEAEFIPSDSSEIDLYSVTYYDCTYYIDVTPSTGQINKIYSDDFAVSFSYSKK